ncbi:translocation/assembly module TamB domain-containing protein [Bowmanella denitrificans]|uniref:translocation/assembly module TamB domain-containing protein n=1 Tax=Bowmanella denitrificans TaxID=366582 RepID=UPI000C9BB886|nr:translocation/assembly module TamB domain-containing protein [Bowmanella denitrificans]
MARYISLKPLLRALLLGLALLLTLLLLGGYWLLATQSGTGWLLTQAQANVPGLKVGQHQGSLLFGLTLSDLHYQQTNLDVNARQLELDISARALLLPHLVVQKLKVNELRIDISTSHDTAPPQGTDAPTDIQLPIPDWLPTARIQQLEINHSQLNLPTLELAWQHLSLNAQLKNKLFTLNNLLLQQTELTLLPSIDAPEPPSSPWPLANLTDLPAPLDMRIKDVQVEDFHLIHSTSPIHIQHAMLQLQWIDKKLGVDRLQLATEDFGQLDLQGSATLKSPYQIAINASLIPGKAWWPEALGNQPVQLGLAGAINALNVQISEPTTLKLLAKAQTDLTHPDLPFSADVALDTAPLNTLVKLPAEADFRPGAMTLSANGDMHSQNARVNFAFSGFGFGQTQPANLALNAVHSPGHVQQLQLQFEDSASQSALQLSGSLAYGELLQWQLQSQIQKLVLNSPVIPVQGDIHGQLDHQGSWSEQKWHVRLDDTQLNGSLNNLPLRLSAVADINQDELLRVSNIDLRLQAFNSTVKITGQADQQWQLQGTAFSDDLSAVLNEGSGKAEANFRVSGALADPLIELNGLVKQLNLQQMDWQDLSIAARYHPMQQHSGELTLSFPHLVVDNSQHFHGSLNLSGNAPQHQLQLVIDGDLNAAIELQGSADLAKASWQGQLNKAESKMYGEHWQLAAPLAIAVTDGQFSLAAHCWQGLFSQLCLKDPLTQPGQQAIVLSASVDYGAWSAGQLNGQQISGAINLDANIVLPEQGQPQLDVRLHSSPGYIRQQVQEQSLSLLEWQGGQFVLQSQSDGKLQLNGELTGEDGQALLKLTSQLGSKADADIDARLQLTPLSLASLMALTPQLSKLDGQLSADISIKGKLDNPAVSGEVQLRQASLIVARTQTALDNLELSARFRDTSVDFDGLFHMGSGKGQIQGSGNWDTSQTDWQKALSLQATLAGQGLQVHALPELQASVSPNLNIRFEQGLLLQGRVNIDKGQLQLQELPASAVDVSEDMVLVNQQEKQKKALLPVNLQLDIELVDPFAVSGFGFNGKIDGTLSARQKSPEPLEVFGALTFTEGLYKAYGQNLEVKSGRLQFLGQADNPVVQLQAIRPLKGTGVEAGIQVSGPVSGLQVELFSNPGMEQSAILSYILRGKPPGAGGESDGRSMAILMAANQGIGITGASGLTDALNNIPLVSDITLDTETDAVSGDSLATVSGYIGERIYLKYGVGILEPVTQITVRFYLLNQLWLEAVSSLERSMDLYYSFDLD